MHYQVDHVQYRNLATFGRWEGSVKSVEKRFPPRPTSAMGEISTISKKGRRWCKTTARSSCHPGIRPLSADLSLTERMAQVVLGLFLFGRGLDEGDIYTVAQRRALVGIPLFGYLRLRVLVVSSLFAILFFVCFSVGFYIFPYCILRNCGAPHFGDSVRPSKSCVEFEGNTVR